MSAIISVGAAVAIIADQRLLLTKREDFEVWCLPGGQSEAGESMAETAVREAFEETGLAVELTGLVGLHSRLAGDANSHLAIFAAKPVGGTLDPQAGEVIDIGYFTAEKLPEAMLPWHRLPALNALAGVTGAVYTTRVKTPATVNSRRERDELRDRSGLSRPAFFEYFFEQDGALQMSRELAGA